MDLKISKARMELAIKVLERMTAKVEDDFLFRGIPVEAFAEREHLLML